MMNPKTTIAGWMTLVGTALAGAGQAIAGTRAGQILTTVGLALAGAGAGLGHIAAKDGV